MPQHPPGLGTQATEPTDSPGTGVSACFGDSGGPALVGDGPTIVGVHAYVTDWSCSSVSYATRIDQPSVLSWIRS